MLLLRFKAGRCRVLGVGVCLFRPLDASEPFMAGVKGVLSSCFLVLPMLLLRFTVGRRPVLGVAKVARREPRCLRCELLSRGLIIPASLFLMDLIVLGVDIFPVLSISKSVSGLLFLSDTKSRELPMLFLRTNPGRLHLGVFSFMLLLS